MSATKKYRLKKDLPFAKAGTEVKIDDKFFVIKKDDFYLVGLKLCRAAQENILVDLIIGHIDDLPTLISEGWIEEVKPREWWMNIYPKNTQRSYLHPTRELAIHGKTAGSGVRGDVETIRVQEVME